MRSKRKRKRRVYTCTQLIGLSIFQVGWFGLCLVALDCLMFHWRTSCHLHWTQCLFYIFPLLHFSYNWWKAARVIYKYRMKCMKMGEQNVGQTEEFNLPRWLLYEPEYNQNSTFSHFIFSFLSNLVSANFERARVCVCFSLFFFSFQIPFLSGAECY